MYVCTTFSKMSYLLYCATGLVGLFSLIYLYAKWKFSYWKKKRVPQLEPQFIYGDTKAMIQGEKSIAETFTDIYKQFKASGAKYGGVYMSFHPMFLPISPELIKDIMQKNFENFTAHFPQIQFSYFKKGLFNLEGEAWRQTRKQLTPTFTSGKMRMMFETLLEKTTGLEALVGEYAESKEPVKIKEILGRFTSDVIGSCGFGIDCNGLKDPNSEFLKNGRIILDPPKRDSYWGLLLRIIGIRKMRKNVRPVYEFFKQIVEETIDYREKNQIYRKDFMHLMIQMKNRGKVFDDEQILNKDGKSVKSVVFDDDYITAQCLTFFIAGYETSATTITFALLELAQHQEIQDKVRLEANEVSKKYEGKINYDALTELVYTEKVIQETLRKYPPLATIPRVCTKNYIIPGTDILIEKGTITQIPAWGLHMDPEYFPDPEKFNPERFSPENKANIKEFTYLPFGEGPRMCIGLRFGMMQSKVGLISVLKNYKFTLNKKTPFPLKMERDTIIISVDGNVWVDIEKV